MRKTLMVIKKSGKSYKCYTKYGVDETVEVLRYISDHRIYRIKIMHRKKLSERLKSFIRRVAYVLVAVKTACSKEFSKRDINRRQEV